MNTKITACLGLAILLVILGCGESAPPPAKATLINSQGQKVGEATLTQTPQGVKISLKVENLPAGVHAFHIHEKGLCTGNTQPATFFKPAPFCSTYWRYTIPGHGVMRWIEAFRILQTFDYKGCVSIELEDANFLNGEAGTKAGILTGAQYLAGC